MADTIEELEAKIRKISSEIFALGEKRNIDCRKLSKEEKHGKDAYEIERNSHSVEWQKLSADLAVLVFKYAMILYKKYMEENSFSYKIMKVVQDCLLCFDESKDIDFIHYMNKSLKNMFKLECQKERIKDDFGGMTNIDKEITDKTIARLKGNANDEKVKGWMIRRVPEYYKAQDGQEKSRFDKTADDRLNDIDESSSNSEKVKSNIFKEIDKKEFSESHKAIITHALVKACGFSKTDLVGHKFFSVAEYEALHKNPNR
ncbi:MAG: hypothetical protein IKQ61_07415 [Spirochaetales bacterium]|nr:hypothetical protein [Spirochaetales bacterium]